MRKKIFCYFLLFTLTASFNLLTSNCLNSIVTEKLIKCNWVRLPWQVRRLAESL